MGDEKQLRRQPLARIAGTNSGLTQQHDDDLPPTPELPDRYKPENMFNPYSPEFLRTGAMDPSKVGNLSWEVTGRDANPKTRKKVADDGNPITYRKVGQHTYASKDTTLGDVSNVLFGEYRSLQGRNPKDLKTHYAGDEQLRKAKSDTAYAILNDAYYAPGTQVAPSILNERARQSPEYKRDFQSYRNTVWDAFGHFLIGKDPVEGRGMYNRRWTGSTAPREIAGRIDPTQTVYRRYGPFFDSYEHNNAWLDIFNPPLNVKPEKGKKR